jgi:hypothetical protein
MVWEKWQVIGYHECFLAGEYWDAISVSVYPPSLLFIAPSKWRRSNRDM